MDRAYKSGASATPPSAPASPSIGYPTEGNPAIPTEATKPGPWWYHMVTEELMGVILAAAITPAQGTLTQLKQALDALCRCDYLLSLEIRVKRCFSAAGPIE